MWTGRKAVSGLGGIAFGHDHASSTTNVSVYGGHLQQDFLGQCAALCGQTDSPIGWMAL